MRIGIGLNLFRPENGGVSNYVLTLLRHWPRLAPEHPMILFSFDHNEELLSLLPPESRKHEIRLQTQEGIFDHLNKIDVYFCPFGSLWPRPVRIPTALTFHDMQERFYPEFFTRKQWEERFFHYDWGLRMADAVITVSDFTRRSCTEIVRIPNRKIRRVYHAPDELPEPVRPAGWALDDNRPFLFYPANFWEHKNHRRLIQALARLRDRGLIVPCVFTGDLLGRDDEWRTLVAETDAASFVRHLGRRPRAELSWLFRHARGLIFPSLFEGFGIPVIEAMQCGCPVACSGLTGLPEIAQGHAFQFDPTDVDRLADAIEHFWKNDALRADLAARGPAYAATFSPERLVQGHLDAFALAQRRHRPWTHWYNRQILLPRSAVPRTELLPHEIDAADRLLRKAAAFPLANPHPAREYAERRDRLAAAAAPAPDFTIVMPTRNHGRWIEQAIRTVLDQNFPGTIELIVFDALSDDNTPEILARYRDAGRLRWIRESDTGQADAINKGLARARGRIVAWLNSDDIYLPHTFARVHAVFAANPALDFVYGDALEIGPEGHVLTPNLFTEDCVPERFYGSHDYICQPTLFVRNEARRRVGYLRGELRWFLDYQWLTRFFKTGLRGERLKYFLAANRDHPSTKTNSGGFARWWEIMRVLSSTPGPYILFRRCVWIYTIEFLIKSLNASPWGASPDSSERSRRQRQQLATYLNNHFMKLVSPRSFHDIVHRFTRDIGPVGTNVAEIWHRSRIAHSNSPLEGGAPSPP